MATTFLPASSMEVEILIPSTGPNPAAPAYQFSGMVSPSNDDSSSTTSSPLSSPLTNMSRSPSPPSGFFDYPSPMSSQLSSVPSSSAASPAPDSREDGSPPAKRRRTSYEPKPRTTQHLDFQTDDANTTQKESLDRLLKAIHNRRKIVVIAGAGISVSAGIPDFRSSKGLFKSLKKEHGLKSSGKDLFDASVYKDGNSTSSFHHMVRQLSNMTKDAEATPFHHLLATLADEGRLLRLYSQNVDGIDTALQPLETTVPLNRKGPWPKTIQLHGGLQKMVCSKCNDMKDLDADLFDGPEPPTCEICIAADNARTEYAGKRSHGVGRLRPRMVLYNEHNPDDEAIGAVVKADMRTRPDCLIVVGTTLKIPGVKRIVKEMGAIIRGRRDGLTIWVNMDGPPPSKDYEWDLIVKGPCDQIAHHAAMRKWNEPKAQTVTPEEAKAIMAQSTVRVVVPPTPKKNREAETSMPTPASSRSASVPPVKKADKKTQKKLVFVQDGLPPKDAKVKAPAKRGKAANKPLTKGVKFVKKATTKQPAGSMQKLAFGISKAGKTASTKSTKKDSKPKSNLPSPAPMAPISPVDAKINSLPAEQVDLKIISSQLERMEPPQQESPHIYNDEPSPPWSPTTPYRHRHYDVESTTRARKTSIDFLLNPASESTGIQDTELLEDAKRNSISI